METSVTILVVEDDEGLNTLIQKTLQKAGFHTKGVFNGSDAMASASYNSDYIMLLDYKLPDMTGKEVIETLLGKNISVPFIIVTGHGDEKIAVELMKLGARDYIIKSAGLREILPQVIKKVVNDLSQEKKLSEAEKSLGLERNKLINILDSMVDGVYIVNQHHALEYINPSLKREFGSHDGKSLHEYLHYDEEICPFCGEQKYAKDEITQREWSSPKNGKTYDLINIPITDIDGSIMSLGVCRDITEQKKKREELENSIKELEEFYNMAVGRELKMKELKTEVDKLRAEIVRLKGGK